MTHIEEEKLLEEIRNSAIPVEGAPDFNVLLDLVGNARFVLLGEATHGTHEFYAARADITMRLIREKNFNAVAVEADWPDAYRVNRYIRGRGLDRFAIDSLADFTRFPTWMWRNTDVLNFIGELHEHNSLLPEESKVGFYGLDFYNLFASIDTVIAYLEKTDPEAAKRARYRYSCFDQFNRDAETGDVESALDIDKSRQDEVVAQLRDLQQQGFEKIRKEGLTARGELFFTLQNARLSQHAEEYYRMMFSGRTSTWNLREHHMVDTLEALAESIEPIQPPKIVVWAHNSHIGDARATDVSGWSQLNLGQIVRERYGSEAALVGFTTHHGTVSSASDWDETVERKSVRPALPESYEDLFHRSEMSSFLLLLRSLPASLQALHEKRLERAIGVVYLPESERARHYFRADLPGQFDAIIHLDDTSAVEPLEYSPVWEAGEIPEKSRIGG
ncbi:MAG: erythromycin esterase family protein [Candidatus Latescibacterota bacterium]